MKSGQTKDAIDRLMTKEVFSYGISNERGGMEIRKPDGSTGLVDFAFLSDKAPEPFKGEWSGGKGINIHHKFVVTDFNLPTAKVFTGSSNLSPSGERGNGDHLVMIEDQLVATSYAIEALRIFDHLHFRNAMQAATGRSSGPVKPLTLRQPRAITGQAAWFEKYYGSSRQLRNDRLLFGH
jgi:phosphatidylserine/phosphatidylglycerophosphate/cardiolipin synthase-like enzyme